MAPDPPNCKNFYHSNNGFKHQKELLWKLIKGLAMILQEMIYGPLDHLKMTNQNLLLKVNVSDLNFNYCDKRLKVMHFYVKLSLFILNKIKQL